MRVLDFRTLADEWEILEAELADAHTDDDMDAVLDLRADREKFTALCNELGISPIEPDTLRDYGDSYEPTLIHEDDFEEYAQQLAEDIGAVSDANAGWPISFIDWERAAEELSIDYRHIEYDGDTYLMRSV